MTVHNDKNIIRPTFSTDLSKCPQCGGKGYILKTMTTPESIEIYGKDTPIEYAVKCPSCNGGHEEKVITVKRGADIPQAYHDKRYNDFNWGIYTDNMGKPLDLSRQKLFVDSFIKNFDKWDDKGLGLYIWSHMKGSGKTFLASCLCNELMSRYALKTKFVSATNLLNIAQSADKNSYNQYEKDPISLLCNCKLLVIDDLGQKNSGEGWLTDILFRITDERMQKKLITIVTSNIKLPELDMDDRVVDRLYGMCQMIPLPDYCVRSKETNDMKVSLFKELGLIPSEGREVV